MQDWERIWRGSGVAFVVLTIVAFFISSPCVSPQRRRPSGRLLPRRSMSAGPPMSWPFVSRRRVEL
jgi:hypothetical protein